MIIKKKFVMLAALSALMCSTSALATYRVDVQCLDKKAGTPTSLTTT